MDDSIGKSPGKNIDDSDDVQEESEQFMNFNFVLKPLAERQLVNSWNIKDPLQYKLDLQQSLEPARSLAVGPNIPRWVQSDQIIYSTTNDLSIFIN